jgi:hypothetical protein
MDEHTSAPELGGADWEIGAAAEAMTSAWLAYTADPTAAHMEVYSEAARRHAAAVASKSMAGMAGMVVPLMTGLQRVETNIEANARRLELSVAASLKRLEDTSEARFDYMLGVIDKHLKTMDTRLDVYGDQIDGFRSDLSAFRQEYRTEVDAVKMDFTLFKTESAADRMGIRHMIEQLPQTEQIKVIEDVLTRLDAVEALVKGGRDENFALLVAAGALVLLWVVVIILSVLR